MEAIPGIPTSQIVETMQLRLRGVSRAFTLFELGDWEALTVEWFDNFYNNPQNEEQQTNDQPSRRHLENGNYGVVAGSMSSEVRVVQDTFDDQNGGVYTIVYSHKYEYQARTSTDDDKTSLGPLQYATLPFRSTMGNDAFSQSLKTRIPDALSGLETPVAVPSIGNYAVSSSDDDTSLSGGAIAGICVGVLVVAAAMGMLVQRYLGGQEKKRAAAALQSARDVGRETLTFEGGDGEENNAWLLGTVPSK